MFLGALLFLLLAVMLAPAQILAMLLNGNNVRLASPAGSLWVGHGQLELVGAPIGELQWRIHPLALLRGAIVMDITLTGPEAQLRGNMELTMATLAVSGLDGVIGEALLAKTASHYDVDLQQPLRITNVAVEVTGRATARAVTSASGQLDWPGGHVDYLLNGQRHAANLGALRGVVSTRAKRAVLTVSDASTHKSALRFSLSAQGWGSAAVTKQFMASTGFLWQGAAPPDAFVLEVEEKLF